MYDEWENAAETRNIQIESGRDITFHKFFLPLYHSIIPTLNTENTLEIGAGTGHLAKEMQKFCKNITAIEPSPSMYKVAQSNLIGSKVKLINKSSYEFISDEKFDLIFSHMCLHTAPNLASFYSSTKNHIKKDGKFVFCIPHPCFYHEYKDYFGESFSYSKEMKKTVDLSISSDIETKMKGIPYFHRPLSDYIKHAGNNGFKIIDMLEPMPSREIEKHYSRPWMFPRYCFFILTA